MRFRIDRYGRTWNLPDEETCPECGQPDNCGDCTHVPLSDEQVTQLRAEFFSHEIPAFPVPAWLR